MHFDRSTLRNMRLAAGLSRSRLAELAGISGENLRRIELGVVATPQPDTAKAIADALGIDVLTLWTDEVAA